MQKKRFLVLSEEKISLKYEMVEEKARPYKRRRKSRSRDMVSNDGVKMEERIWKDFPEDLFERVIAHLPAGSFFKFRAVSRSWRSLLTSSTFLKLCAEAPPHYPWFYTSTDGNINNCAMYDHLLKKWHHMALPFPKTITTPVASAGGLICFLSILERNHGLLICNPLTSTFRILPSSKSPKSWSDIVFGMSFNSTSNSYKLLCFGGNGDYEVYNSLDNMWTSPMKTPPHVTVPISMNSKSQPVFHDGIIYFMRTNPDGLLLFDTVKNTWEQKSIPSLQHSMEHTLAVCKGHVFLVGLLSKNAATCVCVWELQKMTYLWKEVDRMPNMMCLEFYGKPVQMSCLGSKGLVFLSLRSRKLNRLVLYDLSGKIWSRVPNCVLRCRRTRQWITSGISFEPSLYAKV